MMASTGAVPLVRWMEILRELYVVSTRNSVSCQAFEEGMLATPAIAQRIALENFLVEPLFLLLPFNFTHLQKKITSVLSSIFFNNFYK